MKCFAKSCTEDGCHHSGYPSGVNGIPQSAVAHNLRELTRE